MLYLPGFWLKVPNKRMGGNKPSSESILPHYNLRPIHLKFTACSEIELNIKPGDMGGILILRILRMNENI